MVASLTSRQNDGEASEGLTTAAVEKGNSSGRNLEEVQQAHGEESTDADESPGHEDKPEAHDDWYKKERASRSELHRRRMSVLGAPAVPKGGKHFDNKGVGGDASIEVPGQLACWWPI